jgi:Peptidase_C39 like family
MTTRLYPPYVSQLMGGSGGNNCGPACLAMILAHRGVIAPTQEAMLEVADIARDGLSDDAGETGGYTTLNQLAMVAGWYGQTAWYPESRAQIDHSIERGEPVIVLLDNRVLEPRQYPVSPAWNAMHFILLTSTRDGDKRYSSDPLSYYVQSPYFYTEGSTVQGVRNAGRVSCLALVPLEVSSPNPVPEALMLMEEWQVRQWVLADLYKWAGVPYNPDSLSAKGWVCALREGTYLGRPRTAERPYGEGDDAGFWVEYDSGVLWVRALDGAWSVTG